MSQTARPWLQPALFIRNGKYPDAFMQTELAELANHLAQYRLKEICSFGMTMPGVRASPASAVAEPRYRSRYVPSPYAQGVIVYGYLALSTLENPSVDPYALIEIDDDDPGTLSLGQTAGGSTELHYGAASVEASDPDSCGFLSNSVRDIDTAALWVPLQGRSYDVTISDVQSRLVAITVFEIEGAPPFQTQYAAKGPIKSADRSGILTYARNAWDKQAAKLIDWSVNDQAVPRTTTSATAKSLVDNTSTTVSGATPGYTIDLRNRARVSGASTVECLLEAYGSSTDEGNVYLKNSAGTALGTVVINSSTPGWFSAAVSLPNTLAKYDLHFDSSSALETTNVYAVKLSQLL